MLRCSSCLSGNSWEKGEPLGWGQQRLVTYTWKGFGRTRQRVSFAVPTSQCPWVGAGRPRAGIRKVRSSLLHRDGLKRDLSTCGSRC